MKVLFRLITVIFFIIILCLISGDIKADNSFSAIDRGLMSDGYSIPAVHSRERILAELKAFESAKPGSPYSVEPVLKSPYRAGELSEQFLNYGLVSVNFHRFLSGLPADVKLDNDWNSMAQHGAALLAINNKGLSHAPEYPAGIGLPRDFYNRGYTGVSTSNLHSGQGDLAQAVKGFVYDSDSSNIDRLGHRRWVFAPDLMKTGFGFVDGYVAMKVFDHGVGSGRKEKFVYSAWPPAGDMPIAYFPGNSAWSFSINPRAFGGIKGEKQTVAVSLTRVRDGRIWKFGGPSGKSDGYFNIDTESFAIPYCIIFRPDNIGMIMDNDAFDVQISGLSNGKGDAVPVAYKTVFFNSGVNITSDAVSKKPASLTIESIFSTAKFGRRNVSAEKGQLTFGFTGVPLNGFSVIADSPGGIIPVGFSINQSEKIFGPGEWVSDGGKTITSLRVLSSAGGYNIKFTIFCKDKGWSPWADAGNELSFGPSYPIESVSIMIQGD